MATSFDLPWRIHWNLPGRTHGDILRKVRACRPLSLVVELDTLDQAAWLEIPWSGTEVTVVFNGWSSARGSFLEQGVDRWEFPITGPGQAAELRKHFFCDSPTDAVSLRWVPEKGSLGTLPLMLEAAAVHGFGLTLPNRPADGISAPDREKLPDPEELGSLESRNLPALVRSVGEDRLRIHDFMISQLLGLGGSEPSGCEAGNSMAYIDSMGTVFPCRSLLIPLGDLAQESFTGIWNSPVRERIRRDLLKLPSVCASCSSLQACRGGCRGMVYHLYGHYGATDLLCPQKEASLPGEK